jgi:hypothetical protein
MSREQSGRRWKIAVLVFFIIAVLGGAVVARIITTAPPLDSETLCRRDVQLQQAKTVIVDMSDQLSANQQWQVRAAIYGARDVTPIGGKLIVLLMEATSPHDPRELIAKCNPGSVADINPLFATAKRVDRRWREAFGEPVDQVVKELTSTPTAKSSPIMEAISVATSRADFDGRVPKRSLIIVSDLLQNTPGPDGYSQYNMGDLWRTYKRSQIALEIRPDLSNVIVEIVYVTRPADARYQNARHRAFWRAWLLQAGAASVRFLGIPEDKPDIRQTTRAAPAGNSSQPANRTDRHALIPRPANINATQP